MDKSVNEREELIMLRKYGFPSQHRDFWSDEKRQQLQDMFYDGIGISEMAVFFERSEIAIVNQLNSMKLFQKMRNTKKAEAKCKCEKCKKLDCDKNPNKAQ